MELPPGPLFYNVCPRKNIVETESSNSSQFRVTSGWYRSPRLSLVTLHFSPVIYSCHVKAGAEIMITVLTKRSAMLHDKAGVERGWKGVRGRGEWPLIVTDWTHSAARVAIDGYLALRKAHGPR